MSPARTMYRAPARAPVPTRADRLRDLARRVERLGVAGRTAPENVVLTKLTVAEQMRALARELEAVGGMP